MIDLRNVSYTLNEHKGRTLSPVRFLSL